MCVSVRERERHRERVCVCQCERERERECVSVCVCVCVCVCPSVCPSVPLLARVRARVPEHRQTHTRNQLLRPGRSPNLHPRRKANQTQEDCAPLTAHAVSPNPTRPTRKFMDVAPNLSSGILRNWRKGVISEIWHN